MPEASVADTGVSPTLASRRRPGRRQYAGEGRGGRSPVEASTGSEMAVEDVPAVGGEPATAPGAPVGGAAPAPGLGPHDEQKPPRWSAVSTALTEHAQDIVSAGVAIILIVMAGAILVASVVNFFDEVHPKGLTLAATDLLDKVLLVLIVVEIVHTVVLSLRAHALAAQPFLVVGLVAVIRKILFALGSEQKLSVSTLALYMGMIAVFVASLVAIEVFGGRRRDRGGSPGLH